MSIKEDINELKSIKQEIKALSHKTKLLRIRSKVIEKNITKFMSEKKLNGVKDGDTAILLEQTEKKTRNPKSKINTEIKTLLGTHIPQDKLNSIIQQLDDIKFKERETVGVLKFKNIK